MEPLSDLEPNDYLSSSEPFSDDEEDFQERPFLCDLPPCALHNIAYSLNAPDHDSLAATSISLLTVVCIQSDAMHKKYSNLAAFFTAPVVLTPPGMASLLLA